ncbi:hypothetical protein N7533_008865 [Penicillium manginii]|jgi:sorbose reductase|uniref:uncharacterized protein n=1 Tax=Penicillium manginii TaxID=203109 RepID=UPI0025488BDD|nr:uncharacterized protein N7533_008865 [Penicillium manginii]KAJ5743995.1 hypothetical protein N7533_008865 [Penicillium manginii]
MSCTIEEVAAQKRNPRPFPDTPENVFAQFSLKGRTVCVTGASDGIGFAVAEAMAEAGANLALWYNNNPAAKTKGAELAKKHNIKVNAYQVEVSKPEEVQAAVQKVVKSFGRLDIFVANAGMCISKPVLDTSLDEYRRQMAVNVDGVFFCAKYAGEVFKSQGSGNLIITSSISGHIVNVPVDQPVYNATKAYVRHLGKSLAREWREFARVNTVSPGFFNTKMGAGAEDENEVYRMAVLGRQGHVKEIKAAYLYLASDASSFTTGSDIVVDGGYLLP